MDRTNPKNDTPAAHGCSPDVLLVKRNRVGAESREGRLLSNLIKQRPWLDDTTGDRSWAKHHTQNLPWIMNVQVEALAKGGSEMARPSKDEIIRDLIQFFLDDLNDDPIGVGDWLVQGDWDSDEFIEAVHKLKKDLALRD
jgi:hypothetical protein